MPVGSKVASVFGAPIKHFVQGEFTVQQADGHVKTYTITPILLRDRKEAIGFLSAFCDEFYKNGKPHPADKVAGRVDTLIRRFMNGEAWSTWLVRNDEDAIVKWWTIGYGDIDGHLESALMIKKSDQRRGIATGVWQFTTQYLFPILAQQGAKVKTQDDLRKVNLYATSHPDHAVMNHAYEKAGFQVDSTTYDNDFENKTDDGNVIHDGRRNTWKKPVASILNANAMQSEKKE